MNKLKAVNYTHCPSKQEFKTNTMKNIKTLLLLLTLASGSVSLANIADLSTREAGYFALGGGSQRVSLKFNSKFGYQESRENTNLSNKGAKDLDFGGGGVILQGGQFIAADKRVGVQYVSASDSGFKTTLFGLYGDYLFNSGIYVGLGLNYMTLDFVDEPDIKKASDFVATYRVGMLFKIGDNVGLDINYQLANQLMPATHKGYTDTDLSDGSDSSIASNTAVGDYENWSFISLSLSYHF
jgi:hypothetical protein